MDAEAARRRLAAVNRHLGGGVARGTEAESARSIVAPSPVAATSFRADRLLDGQVAIITGAGQGLGAAAARLFASHGAKVLVADLDAAKAESVAAEINGKGVGSAKAFGGDVTAADFAPRCVKAALDAFGGQSIDVLVNNAGYTWDGMAHKIKPEQWQAMLDVHCTAPFRLIQAAAPYMRDAAKREIEAGGAARPRSIVNVSSTSGTHGNAGQANYATAKAGVVGLTKTVAREWGGFNVRCNAVAFGFIATRLTGDKGAASISVGGKEVPLGIPGGEAAAEAAAEMMIPLKRVGTPEEGAGAMLMLASPYSSFISGQTIEVTGGAFI